MDTPFITGSIAVVGALSTAVIKLYLTNQKLNKQVQTILERELKNSKATEKSSSSLLKTITDQQKVVYERTIPNSKRTK